jgi:hypothetical protein
VISLNFSALDYADSPAMGGSAFVDADGLTIPELWRNTVEKWSKLPYTWRLKRSREYLAELAAVKQPSTKARTSAPRFSTDACIAWGRSKGWKLIDRERYDARLKRHHDLLLGADAMMEGPTGIIYIQGAGRSEKKVHRERFDARGGIEKARRLKVQFVYVEFDRGTATPILEEWWA